MVTLCFAVLIDKSCPAISYYPLRMQALSIFGLVSLFGLSGFYVPEIVYGNEFVKPWKPSFS
jgi:hypothetical protein